MVGTNNIRLYRFVEYLYMFRFQIQHQSLKKNLLVPMFINYGEIMVSITCIDILKQIIEIFKIFILKYNNLLGKYLYEMYLI